MPVPATFPDYIADTIASNIAGSLVGVSGVFLSGATIDLIFTTGQYFGVVGAPTSFLTTTRASSKTNLFPTSASGFAYSTFTSGVPSITSLGLSVEETRTNVLLNSSVPATQTTASLGTGVYTLWVNGSGSAASSAGTATITGAGSATNGSPNVFTVTVAGTVTVTVTGSLNAFQCELGTFGTSLIVTAGATGTRATDVVTLTAPPAFGAAYSMFAQAIPQAPIGFANAQPFIQVDNGTDAQRTLIRRTTAGGFLVTSVGGSGGAPSPAGTLAQFASGKVAGAFAAGDQAAVFNGGAVATTSGAALPTTPTVVRIGTDVGGLFLDGFIQRIALWPTTRISNAQLQAITT